MITKPLSELPMLTEQQINTFNRDGYLVLKQAIDKSHLQVLQEAAAALLHQAHEPAEYEADLQYPGAPESRAEPGGATIRRMLQLYDRDEVFRRVLQIPAIKQALSTLLGGSVWLAKAHHNCLMTKQPEHSSDSLWHQDIRYWSFARESLITSWLALGEENAQNGCLQVVPGSHKMRFSGEQLDDARFFIADHPDNKAMIARRVHVELAAGDVLLFHCRLVHAASRNFSDRVKYAIVYTFRGEGDVPLKETRSSRGGEVQLV